MVIKMKWLLMLTLGLILFGCDDKKSSDEQEQFNCECETYEQCNDLKTACVLISGKCETESDCSGEMICDDLHSCSCPDQQHLEDRGCVANQKDINCIDQTPENGVVISAESVIDWDGSQWSDTPICDFSCKDGYEKKGNFCEEISNGCRRITLGPLLTADATATIYEGNTGDGEIFKIYFYGRHMVDQAYDLGTAPNDTYKDCKQCVLIEGSEKSYFQRKGTLTLTELESDSGFMTGKSKGNITGLELQESIIDGATSETVENGECLYIPEVEWDTITPYIPPTKKWTVMVYLDGDNDLEPYALDDFNELESGLAMALANGNKNIMEQLNIIVLIDRNNGYSYKETEPNGDDWSETRLYRIKPDGDYAYFNSEQLDDGAGGIGHIDPIGEKNLGDPATLKWFLSYSQNNFPAEYYSLIFWNHGGGARKKGISANETVRHKAVCWDEDNGDDALFLDEVQQGVKAVFDSSNKLDIIGFDACIMGTVEVAYEFRELANYMVASMNYEQEQGWDYEYIFSQMNGNLDESTITPARFSQLIVQAYEYFIEPINGYDDGESLAATDLSQIVALKSAIDQFAAAIHKEDRKGDIESIRNNSVNFNHDGDAKENYPYFDLYDVAKNIVNGGFSSNLNSASNNVIAAMKSAIIADYGDDGNGQSYFSGLDSAANRGLSIFFTRSSGYYNIQREWYVSGAPLDGELYGYIDFANTTDDGSVNTWKELMDAWYDQYQYMVCIIMFIS